MNVNYMIRIFVLASAFALAGAVSAQETTAPAEVPGDAAVADDLSLGVPEDQVGKAYTLAAHGAWEVRCVKSAGGVDPCQLYQLLSDQDGNPVAEISLFNLPPDGEVAAGATIITPLETLLTQSIRMQIDAAPAKTYPFSWCATIGCVARVGFTADEVAQLKRGVRATVRIVPVAAPDKEVLLSISLNGFTAGLAAVAEQNAKFDAAGTGEPAVQP